MKGFFGEKLVVLSSGGHGLTELAMTARDDNLIFDIGCHIGEDADFYLKKGFRVVAVEANPYLCTTLKQRFSSAIQEGRFVLIEKAIAKSNRHVTFFSHSTTIWGTTRKKSAGNGFTPICVAGETFASILKQFGVPYYAKIDIEGSDRLCLRGLLKCQARPKFLSIEHPYQSLVSSLINLALFFKLGYDGFKIIDQALVIEQREPFPSQEGKHVGEPILLGSSGLFGSDLPGRWLTRKEVTRLVIKDYLIKRFWQIWRRLPVIGRSPKRNWTWYDLHARISGQ